jgi:hypothetical protein
MTAVSDASTTNAPEELPVNPFIALRVAYGMLLGELDFKTLMGQPRGKLMLHNAWLHGMGVVWGYRVVAEGVKLRVAPGLALDGIGRELYLPAEWCVDLDDWYAARSKSADPPPVEYDDKGAGTVDLHLAVSFGTCRTGAVPALADPCDLSGKHTSYSRVVETARLELRYGPPPDPAGTQYRRIRMLLGLMHISDDAAGREVQEARQRIAFRPPHERAIALLAEFRRLAAWDAMELGPAKDEQTPGDDCDTACPSPFPAPEDPAGVVLAGVRLHLACSDGRTTVTDADVCHEKRATLIPTATIQELACGLAPGVLGHHARPDAGGPRVIRASLRWRDPSVLTFQVTDRLRRHTLRRHVVNISSLADAGWVEEDIQDLDYDDGTRTVTVQLFNPPAQEDVRVVVRGTGRTPVTGTTGIPLAGRDDGPPGTEEEGHDAVMRIRSVR